VAAPALALLNLSPLELGIVVVVALLAFVLLRRSR